MLRKKRHTAEEIGVKLHQAEEMAREGRFQGEIARALGVSVMTYHRWRKARQSLPAVPTLVNSGIVPSVDFAEEDNLARLGDLELENSRLRRLVTDLLLEKVKLEEERCSTRKGVAAMAAYGTTRKGLGARKNSGH